MIKSRSVGMWMAVLVVAVGSASAELMAQTPSTAGEGSQMASEGPLMVNAQRGPDRPELQTRNPRYRISNSDQLDLDFPLTPEFNQTVTVQPDGYITLRGVGDVHVEGKTVPELTQTLKIVYATILHEPIITVSLKDFEKPYFIATGQVAHPGKYDLRGDTTVVQAVAIAGGFTDSAKHSQILLFRRASNDWIEVKKINVKQLLHAENLEEDLHLRPGDMLYVPKSVLGKIQRLIPNWGFYFNPAQF